MSEGITFYSKQEALDYMETTRHDGKKPHLLKLGNTYIVYIGQKISAPDIIKERWWGPSGKSWVGEHRKEDLIPEKHFHITWRNLGLNPTLRISEPNAYFDRVSFSSSVEGALSGMSGGEDSPSITRYEFGKPYYFYVYTPSKRTVGYRVIEGLEPEDTISEVGSLANVEAKLLGKIKVWVDEPGSEVKWEWI